MSLSARRAWIEIRMCRCWVLSDIVALRKESVDRNLSMGLDGRFKLWSLSARRAWIEIAYGALDGASEIVALRKESVDRNKNTPQNKLANMRRSPQGERG